MLTWWEIADVSQNKAPLEQIFQQCSQTVCLYIKCMGSHRSWALTCQRFLTMNSVNDVALVLWWSYSLYQTQLGLCEKADKGLWVSSSYWPQVLYGQLISTSLLVEATACVICKYPRQATSNTPDHMDKGIFICRITQIFWVLDAYLCRSAA